MEAEEGHTKYFKTKYLFQNRKSFSKTENLFLQNLNFFFKTETFLKLFIGISH